MGFLDGITIKCTIVLMWNIFLVLLVVILLAKLFLRLKDRRSGLLSSKIRSEKKRIHGGNIAYGCHEFSIGLRSYNPDRVSKNSLIVISILSIVIFALCNWNSIIQILDLPDCLYLNYKAYETGKLIDINVGLSTIIIALVIFTVESIRGRNTNLDARILLKKSLLVYLVPLAILNFIANLFFETISFVSVISVAFGALVSLISLLSIISLFSIKGKFSHERISTLRKDIEYSIGMSTNTIIGDRILLGNLKDLEIKMKYYPFADSLLRIARMDLLVFRSKKGGTVEDIDLRSLRLFSEILESEANKNGFSFIPDKKNKSNLFEIEGDEHALEIEDKDLEVNDKRYLTRKLADLVEKNDGLIVIDRQVVHDDRVLKKLERLQRRIFVIQKGRKASDDDIVNDLSDLRSEFLRAIDGRDLNSIEEYITLYQRTIDSLAKLLFDYSSKGFTDDLEVARTFKTSDMFSVDILKEDLEKIVERALGTENGEIIEKICFFPIWASNIGLQYENTSIYRKLIGLSETVYFSCFKIKNLDLRKSTIERLVGSLRDISKYYIIDGLEHGDNEERHLLFLKDSGIYVLKIFQKFLRASIHYQDPDSYKKTLQYLGELFSRFIPSRDEDRLAEIDLILSSEEMQPEKREDLELEKNKTKLLIEIEKEFNNGRSLLLFGVTSFLLEECRDLDDNKLLNEIYQESERKLVNELSYFTEIFLLAYNREVHDSWGWQWWETELHSGEDVFVGDINGKLETLYCVKALRIIANKTKGEIERIELPLNEVLSNLSGDNGGIYRKLNEIKSESGKWKSVLGKKEIGKIPSLIKLLRNSRKMQEADEKRKLKEALIEKESITKFEQDVLESFSKEVKFRRIMWYYGLYENRSKERYSSLTKSRFGFNKSISKESFSGRSVDTDLGKYYGKKMANGEDSRFLKKIAKYFIPVEGQTFEALLDKFDDTSSIVVILVSAHRGTRNFFTNPDNFSPKGHSDLAAPDLSKMKGFSGLYYHNSNQIPFFEVFDQDSSEMLLAFDKDRFGKFIQYSPLSEGDPEDLVREIFYIDVHAFSEREDSVKLLVDESPEWLKRIGNTEEQIEYLKEKVWLRILERFEFIVHSEFSGYRLTLSDELKDN